MKVMFDSTKYTQWYIDETGSIFASTTYRGRSTTMQPKAATLNRKRGYMYVRTSNKNLQVHRLVATAFVPNPHNKGYVNHIDGDKTNNHYTNLGWVTCSENMQHAMRNGLAKQLKKNEGPIKYTLEQCRDVMRRIESGMKYKDAGAKYGMPYSTVAHLARGSRRAL